jgi:hypothetical protein
VNNFTQSPDLYKLAKCALSIEKSRKIPDR